jgi:hypothetical protein
MHPRIFNHFGAMPANLFLRIHAQKLSIRFAEEDNAAIRISNYYAAQNIIQDGFI